MAHGACHPPSEPTCSSLAVKATFAEWRERSHTSSLARSSHSNNVHGRGRDDRLHGSTIHHRVHQARVQWRHYHSVHEDY